MDQPKKAPSIPKAAIVADKPASIPRPMGLPTRPKAAAEPFGHFPKPTMKPSDPQPLIPTKSLPKKWWKDDAHAEQSGKPKAWWNSGDMAEASALFKTSNPGGSVAKDGDVLSAHFEPSKAESSSGSSANQSSGERWLAEQDAKQAKWEAERKASNEEAKREANVLSAHFDPSKVESVGEDAPFNFKEPSSSEIGKIEKQLRPEGKQQPPAAKPAVDQALWNDMQAGLDRLAAKFGFDRNAPKPKHASQAGTGVDKQVHFESTPEPLGEYQPPDDPWWTESEAAKLYAAVPVKLLRKATAGNVTKGVSQIEFASPDGTKFKGWAKPQKGESWARYSINQGRLPEREVAAWELAKIMDMGHFVPETVMKGMNDDRYSVQMDTGGKPAGFDSKKFGTREMAAAIAAFDFAIGNFDRHGDNWHIMPDGSLKLIDHSLAFPHAHDRNEGINSEFVHRAYWHKMAIPKIAKEWANRWSEIEKSLYRNNLSPEEIAMTKKRLFMLQKADTMRELVDNSGIKPFQTHVRDRQ